MVSQHDSLRNRLETRRRRHGRWRALALVVGLGLGLGLGLYVGWVAWPTQYTGAFPGVLDERYREDYVQMIAAAYAEDGDLAGARRRLAGLGEQDIAVWLRAFTVDQILAGAGERDVRQLVRLATALDVYSPVMDPYLPGR